MRTVYPRIELAFIGFCFTLSTLLAVIFDFSHIKTDNTTRIGWLCLLLMSVIVFGIVSCTVRLLFTLPRIILKYRLITVIVLAIPFVFTLLTCIDFFPFSLDS